MVCSIPLCSTDTFSRGLCKSHYNKHYTAGTLDTVAKPTPKRHTLSAKDLDELTAVCGICGPTKIVYKKPHNKFYCKNSTSIMNYTQFKYGEAGQLTYGQVVGARSKYTEEQGDICSICKKPADALKALALDHCHETGKIRGLLCTKCNMGLGLFDDDVTKLKAAIEYLNL